MYKVNGMLVNFACFLLSDFFSKLTFSEKSCRIVIYFVKPDLCQNSWQKLSSEDSSRQKLKSCKKKISSF